MTEPSIIFSFFIIFSGAAVLSTMALMFRQPMLIAYIGLGILVGPFTLDLIPNTAMLDDVSEIGIIFLLFLLGLDMQPSSLLHTLKKTTNVALISSVLFAVLGFLLATIFGFSQTEAIITGLCMMFSSTIIGIKLLPTTVLHHKHTGELMVGILLLQDLIAILVLVGIGGIEQGASDILSYVLLIAAFPLLIGISWLGVRFVILPLFMKFDRFQEYIFLCAIGWCLGLAELAELLDLSYEVGAFIAGISLASSPISQFIAISLKPLRDFFLVLFFFTLGANYNVEFIGQIYWQAGLLAIAVIVIKPVVFRLLLSKLSERNSLSWDVGFRLGQISEFSLVIVLIATSSALISAKAASFIQTAAIITFAISSYIVMMYFPNPIATKEELRRD